MKIYCQCDYCGHTFHEWVYSKEATKNIVCVKCRDKNIKILSTENEKIDYYQGSAPFHKKL